MTHDSFFGYRRANGRAGIRNYVLILPVDDISNAACEGVANNVHGTMALPHSYGRLQYGEDLDLHFRTIIGCGANPNVAAVLVIGIEPGWTKRVVDGIAATGKPVRGLHIEGKGELTTIAEGCRVAQEFVQYATELQRERIPIEDLWVATKCGESDTTSGIASCPAVGNLIDKLDARGITSCFGETTEITGGEKLCASRAANPEAAAKFMKVFQAYQDEVMRFKVDDLSDSQPSKGNKAGGLSTIEEKAFGNLQKIGEKAMYIDVLAPAEAPSRGPGLYYMDTSSAAAECLPLQAAAGFVLHLFPTGQGNVVGNPIMPTIKLTANPRTARVMKEHIDLDVSDVLRRKMTISQAGDALIDMAVRTSNGRLTTAETLRHREFAMTKLYRSA